MMITVIDYKSGNLKSIYNGFKKIGVSSEITRDLEKISSSEFLVLPGVGAFGTAMGNIEPFEKLIIEHVNDDKPFLGICLGQQLLLEGSEEAPDINGLGLFKGQSKKISNTLKIPHMGWNQLNTVNNSPILEGIDKKYFYFVHSYHVVPCDNEIIAGTCNYGNDIVASLHQNNTFTTQFHPEKSGPQGLKILKNFINLKQ